MTSATAGNGSVEINLNNGASILPSVAAPFTLTLVNGTASPQSVGGNSIPSGCFSGSEIFGGSLKGSIAKIFGCYSDTSEDFDFSDVGPKNGSQVCHAKEM
jgi:hypothetical protein